MIRISRTPLRVSFFGGGTDYAAYFEKFPGTVVGTTINLYVYIIALPMPDFCEQKYRFLYRMNESVNSIEEITHPVIRAVLREEDFHAPLNVAIMSDVPAGTGLGSSSSFTVGFVNLVKSLKGVPLNRYALARRAIYIEHDVLSENVGVQDQIHAAYGGLSRYSFHKDEFSIHPVRINVECQNALDHSMFLLYTEISRHASESVAQQLENTRTGRVGKELAHLVKLAEQSVAVLEQRSPDQMLKELGHMLNEGWQTKRSLSTWVTSPKIDEMYEAALRLGAYGGKLCGAGAGGFIFVLAPHHLHQDFVERFGERNVMRITTEMTGSRVTTLGDEMQLPTAAGFHARVQ